jgi:AraC-like DNA-binding protein
MSSRVAAFSIPAIYFRVLINHLIERGYDCAPWLQTAQIAFDHLMRPDAMIALPQADRLLCEIELGTGRRDWGFELGTMLRLTSHGSVGFAMISGATLHDTVLLCSRYYRLMVPFFSMELIEEGDIAALHYQRVTAVPIRLLQFYEEVAALATVTQIANFVNNRDLRLEVRMAQKAPPHSARYAAVNNTVFRFNDPDTLAVSVFFQRRFLATPNPFGDPGSQLLAEEICQRKIHELNRLEGWTEWVTTAIRSADGVRPTQAELAKLLHMSARTLERALTREGNSFTEICETVGFERAIEMLKERRMSISQISDRLGYSNPGAFSRAFKRHSGVTPREFIQRIPDKQ